MYDAVIHINKLADILPKNTKNEIKKHIYIFYNSFIK